MAFNTITYFPIFGLPFIAYLGMTTLTLIVITAFIGWLNLKRPGKIHFKWHIRAAAISLILAFLHGLLGVLAYF